MYNYTDSMALGLKATVCKFIVGQEFKDDLPSLREAKIQVEKFERMIEAFDKKFPPELWKTGSEKRLSKMRGVARHKVNLQGKVVDRLIMKVTEELAASSFKSLPNGTKKPTKGQIRSAAQKYVNTLNSAVYKSHQKKLKEMYASLEVALGGEKATSSR